ncbi:MAG: hypothetical protein V4546_16555 [Bacteroidota bacterium]
MEKRYTAQYLKKLIILILLCISGFTSNATSYGCNLGNDIYPNPTGKRNSGGYPTYFNSNPIAIRWWEGDKKCGILSSKIRMRSNTEDKCEVLGNNWGVVYAYNPADNNCQTVQVPIDNYIWILIFAVGGIGAYLISKKGQLI